MPRHHKWDPWIFNKSNCSRAVFCKQCYLDSPTGNIQGILQKLVLGPLLFLIFINDLPTQNVHVCRWLCYRNYRAVANASDPLTFHKLNHVKRWCDDWLMELNLRLPYPYAKPYPSTTTSLYLFFLMLSVTLFKQLNNSSQESFSNNLSWDLRVTNVIPSANIMVGFLQHYLRNAAIPGKY